MSRLEKLRHKEATAYVLMRLCEERIKQYPSGWMVTLMDELGKLAADYATAQWRRAAYEEKLRNNR